MNPIYIKVDRHKKVNAVIDRIKASLDEARTVLNRLNELREEEERELHEWKSEVDRITSKVSYIEDALSSSKEKL